jgi:hypothetical protein
MPDDHAAANGDAGRPQGPVLPGCDVCVINSNTQAAQAAGGMWMLIALGVTGG